MPRGHLSGEHFVEDDSQRIDVRSVIDELRAIHLLRRHIPRRSHDLVCARECEVVPRTGGQFREAEVCNFDAAPGIDENVFGLMSR